MMERATNEGSPSASFIRALPWGFSDRGTAAPVREGDEEQCPIERLNGAHSSRDERMKLNGASLNHLRVWAQAHGIPHADEEDLPSAVMRHFAPLAQVTANHLSALLPLRSFGLRQSDINLTCLLALREATHTFRPDAGARFEPAALTHLWEAALEELRMNDRACSADVRKRLQELEGRCPIALLEDRCETWKRTAAVAQNGKAPEGHTVEIPGGCSLQERIIFLLRGKGRSIGEIAPQLGLSPYEALKIHSAVVRGVRGGLHDAPPVLPQARTARGQRAIRQISPRRDLPKPLTKEGSVNEEFLRKLPEGVAWQLHDLISGGNAKSLKVFFERTVASLAAKPLRCILLADRILERRNRVQKLLTRKLARARD